MYIYIYHYNNDDNNDNHNDDHNDKHNIEDLDPHLGRAGPLRLHGHDHAPAACGDLLLCHSMVCYVKS